MINPDKNGYLVCPNCKKSYKPKLERKTDNLIQIEFPNATPAKPNLEYDKCARCGEKKGEIPIFDDTKNTYWICEYCDAGFFETTAVRIEGIWTKKN